MQPKTFSQNPSEAEFRALAEFNKRLQLESHPDDPLRSLEAHMAMFKAGQVLKDQRLEHHTLTQADQIIALLSCQIEMRPFNRHLMRADIRVLPEYRRQGLAKQLLSQLLKVAKEYDRTIILGAGHDRAPAGKAFAQRLGAKAASQVCENRLELNKVAHVETWLEEAKEKSKDFYLEFCEGSYPEKELEPICRLIESMNDAPIDDLALDPFRVTPEMVRNFESYFETRGLKRWVYFVRHRESHDFAGFSVVFFDRFNPKVLIQDDTSVISQYRGHALGRYLKAAMLDKVRRERPEIKTISTHNAVSNRYMLAINHAMGFKPYLTIDLWQLERAQLETYL
ncbi:MAG: GNAT family N-acetyltransferase [Deinococcales bacterium]